MSAPLKITRSRSATTASCEQCDRLHPEATRERVRLHVNQTGHTAHVLIEDLTTYRPISPESEV